MLLPNAPFMSKAPRPLHCTACMQPSEAQLSSARRGAVQYSTPAILAAEPIWFVFSVVVFFAVFVLFSANIVSGAPLVSRT